MPKPVGEMTLAEVGDELNSVVTECRNIVEKAEKEGRTKETLQPAEVERVNRLHAPTMDEFATGVREAHAGSGAIRYIYDDSELIYLLY